MSLRFQFHATTLHSDEEVFDADTRVLTHTIRQISIVYEDGKVWLLCPRRYRAFGLSDSLMGASTELLVLKESSTCSIQAIVPTRVKLEPELETIYELSDDELPEPHDVYKVRTSSYPVPQCSAGSTSSATIAALSPSTKIHSIVECLKKLVGRKGSRNVFKQIDYHTVDIHGVEFLPPKYNGDIIFEFLPLGSSSKDTKAKHLCGMDKQYDGHVWTRTHISNSTNEFGLIFCMSFFCGYLLCKYVDCKFLTLVHWIADENVSEWDGMSLFVF